MKVLLHSVVNKKFPLLIESSHYGNLNVKMFYSTIFQSGFPSMVHGTNTKFFDHFVQYIYNTKHFALKNLKKSSVCPKSPNKYVCWQEWKLLLNVKACCLKIILSDVNRIYNIEQSNRYTYYGEFPRKKNLKVSSSEMWAKQ